MITKDDQQLWGIIIRNQSRPMSMTQVFSMSSLVYLGGQYLPFVPCWQVSLHFLLDDCRPSLDTLFVLVDGGISWCCLTTILRLNDDNLMVYDGSLHLIVTYCDTQAQDIARTTVKQTVCCSLLVGYRLRHDRHHHGSKHWGGLR